MAKKLFKIQTDKIENGTKLMYENTALTSWVGDLSSLTNGTGMFFGCFNLTTFTSDLSSLTNGDNMFGYCTDIESFTSDLSSLTDGYEMFNNCYNLTTFTSDLSSLTNGDNMFRDCDNLTTFTSDLSSLTNGDWMFGYCSKFTTFTSNLSSLTSGIGMFANCTLNKSSVQNIALTINKNTSNARISLGINTGIKSNEQVKRDLGLIKYKGWDLYVNNSNATSNYTLPKYAGCTTRASIVAKNSNYKTNDIVNGVWAEHLPDLEVGLNDVDGGLFYDCTNLTSFSADLSSMTNGSLMFFGCTNLTSFKSNLSSLTYGISMFYNCKLDTASVQNIADTIKNVTDSNNGYVEAITIYIGNSTPNEQEEAAFNKMVSKGWTV